MFTIDRALTSVQATMGVAPSASETNDVEMNETQEPSGVLPAEVASEIEETQKA